MDKNEYINAIATGSVIMTSDRQFVMGKRGKTMHLTNIDFIGGGLQEDEFIVNDIKDFKKNTIKEIQEEINLRSDMIKQIEGLGIIFSTTTNILFFYKSILNIDSIELMKRFRERNDTEMEDLILIKSEKYKDYLKTLPGYRPLVAALLN